MRHARVRRIRLSIVNKRSTFRGYLRLGVVNRATSLTLWPACVDDERCCLRVYRLRSQLNLSALHNLQRRHTGATRQGKDML